MSGSARLESRPPFSTCAFAPPVLRYAPTINPPHFLVPLGLAQALPRPLPLQHCLICCWENHSSVHPSISFLHHLSNSPPFHCCSLTPVQRLSSFSTPNHPVPLPQPRPSLSRRCPLSSQFLSSTSTSSSPRPSTSFPPRLSAARRGGAAPMARRPGSIDSFTPDGRPLSIRGSNNSSNPNVFSDDYAVDTADSLNSLSRSQSITSRPESLSVIRDSPDRAVNSDSVTGLSSTVANSSPLNRTSLPEASSIPQRIVSISSHADTHRTLSTSSHFSIPRAPSPYNGPTAPSHPYGMYNQVTRASSIISDSTIRPVDSPFVPQGGPEHPYGMYQNTVPEEEDDAQLTTPLGFPVLGSSAASTSRSSGNDVGDIVGTDGHVEQLPPYSRYADNVIAKSDLDRIDRGGAVPSSTESLTPPPTTDTSSTSNIEPTPITPSTTDEELARKEGMKRKRTNRKIFGLPFWTFVIVVASVIVAALVGGVIGGIVGNRKGAEHALG